MKSPHLSLVIEPGPGTVFPAPGLITGGTAEVTAFSSKHFGIAALSIFSSSSTLGNHRHIAFGWTVEEDGALNKDGNIVLDSENDFLAVVEPLQKD